MAATKRSGKKGGAAKAGGAAKKGGAKRGSSKKGGAKKGSTRGLGSVLSGIGSIAGTVGSIAGTVGGITGGRRAELRVGASRNSGINDIVTALKKKFREAGCPGCRSGIDRIIFEDILTGGGGGR
jgi:hypothetical protein